MATKYRDLILPYAQCIFNALYWWVALLLLQVVILESRPLLPCSPIIFHLKSQVVCRKHMEEGRSMEDFKWEIFFFRTKTRKGVLYFHSHVIGQNPITSLLTIAKEPGKCCFVPRKNKNQVCWTVILYLCQRL